MSDDLGPPHPQWRAEDFRDPRVDVVLNELGHIRRGVADVDEKVTAQNGRISKLETQALVDRTRDETLAAVIRERSDRNLKLIGLMVSLVGAAVTLAVKLL